MSRHMITRDHADYHKYDGEAFHVMGGHFRVLLSEFFIN